MKGASRQLRRTCFQHQELSWLSEEGKGKRMSPLPCHLLCLVLLPLSPSAPSKQSLGVKPASAARYTLSSVGTGQWTRMWQWDNKNNSHIYKERKEAAHVALPTPNPPSQRVRLSALQSTLSVSDGKEHCLKDKKSAGFPDRTGPSAGNELHLYLKAALTSPIKAL